MRDIFLSYASADRKRARRLVEALETSGWTVWWDRQLAVGRNYEEEIQERLEASRCVVVLWSRTSVKSRWVKAEAQDAAEQNRLFPAFLDRVKAPLEYRYLNGVDLTRWDGSPQDAEYVRLIEALRSPVGSSSAPAPAPAPAATTVSAGPPTPGPTASPPAAVDGAPPAAGLPAGGPADQPGEVTAMRLIANELSEILDRVAGRRRGSRSGPASPDPEPGEVTTARAISRKLAQALATFADSRGRVLPSTLALRYLAWSLALPTALLLALHAADYLMGSGG